MLAIFPDLLTYGLYGPTLLRLVAGGLLIAESWRLLPRVGGYHKLFPIIQILFSILLVLGLYTQVIAGALALGALALLIRERRGNIWRAYRLLILTVLLSFLVTGPGLLGFDLPL